ncbi:M1 family metallopeptidase [Paracrocinitomix mangrovi]|uniref:M1 family metallopeptidase n=1 Tax=Paracrocinitomix mangrovi TaxID=2862509 RepID=UPI001C8D5F32|nr:M1 family metallopeptidase [Paracrocinitomix mangrovi]UKN00419.1 M1 family metallopeptidase [Paracrocinitomix mangrovi]
MKKSLILALCLSSFSVFSQGYFQQEVNYKIDVKLNDKDHTLSAFEEFEYINNSTTALDKIYIHLWPNGYKNNETALAKQLYDQGNTVMQFAEEKDLGWIDSLNFKIDGNDAKWELDPENIDIAILHLNSVLKPGESIKVSTPFKVKLPSGSISRLGHIEESYQITQWYPKPAVFDKDGWHAMPYLTQGEFYSEYGSFDVSITLPKNYVVGATGDLQTESELAFLEEKVAATQAHFESETFSAEARFPDSDKEFKTVRFTQSNVHDFAWFADKRFEVLKGEVELPHSKRKVTTWAMFVPYHNNLWKDAIEYINDGTYYYSKWNGDYPYNNVTAIDGTISAGGGMEYPNITVIGNAGSAMELEVVIVHEVGHNWFYGQLGSNERDHAWMDEGLNTHNEIRYIQTKYPNNQRMSEMMMGMAETFHFEHLSHHDMNKITYQTVAAYGVDQPIELPSADYAPVNYGAIVYAKTGLEFTYLRDYLGDEEFDKGMQLYYKNWEFKHPQPNDMRAALEESSGKNLAWMFDEIIPTTKQIDYKIAGVKAEDGGFKVKVKNAGQVDCPVRVDAYRYGKLTNTVWLEPGGEDEVFFKGNTFDEFIIDAGENMPDVNRNNNYWKKKGLFAKAEPLKMEFLLGDNEGRSNNAWYTPVIGGNKYDVIMLGVLFHNQTIPKNRLEYTISPLFSVGRLNVAGFADLNYTWTPPKNFKAVTLGLTGKTFGMGIQNPVADSTKGPRGTYYVAHPYLKLAIGKPAARKHYKQNLTLKGAYVYEDGGANFQSTIYGGYVEYDFDFKKRIHSFNANTRVDYVDYNYDVGAINVPGQLMNGQVAVKYGIQYWPKKKKSVELRGYFGQNFMYNGTENNRFGMSLAGQSGTQDVFYEWWMMGRNESSGFYGNQRIENQGGFKTVSDSLTTTSMLFGTNLIFEIPYLPVVLYADFGMLDRNGTMITAYDFGAGIRFSDVFGVYFPIVESSNMYSTATKYWNRIRLTINMNGLRPAEIIRKVL